MDNEIGTDGLVKDNYYSKAINLTYKTVLNNLCLRLYYPKWDGKDETINTHSGMLEDDVVQAHLSQISDLKKAVNKLSYFEKNNYMNIKPSIEKEARQDFKIAMEKELTSLYHEYKRKFNPELPWNYAIANRYMETYDKVFGRETLMQVPAVRSFKEDYEKQMNKDLSVQKTKNKEKSNNGSQNGLLSKFVQSSSNVVDEDKQKADLNLKHSETNSMMLV